MMTDPRQARLDEIETAIAREEAEDALVPDDAPRREIATFEGFAGMSSLPRVNPADRRATRRGDR